MRRDERLAILNDTATGRHAPDQAMATLDALRWLERVAYHVWRISNHLAAETPAVEGSQEPMSALEE